MTATGDERATRGQRIGQVADLAATILTALVDQAATDDLLLGGYMGQHLRFARSLAALIGEDVDDILTNSRNAAHTRAELRPDGTDPMGLHELTGILTSDTLDAIDVRPNVHIAPDLALLVANEGTFARAHAGNPLAPAEVVALKIAGDDTPKPAPVVNEWVTRAVRDTLAARGAATARFAERHRHTGTVHIEDTPPRLDVDDGPTRVVSCGGCGATLTITVTHDLTTTTVTAVERAGG